MIRECAVLTVLIAAIVLALEKPTVVSACNTSACFGGSGSSSCSCPDDPGDPGSRGKCFPDSASLLIKEYLWFGDCGVRVQADWACTDPGRSATLTQQDGGAPEPGCNLPGGPGDCTGQFWSTPVGDLIVEPDPACTVGWSYFRVILELLENCGECQALDNLIVESIKCYCDTCPP